MTSILTTRRDVLKSAGLAAAALAAGSLVPSRMALGAMRPLARADRRRVLRIAHLTDIHVQPERRGGEGLAACLAHLAAQTDKPDVVVTGGDLVMDSFESDEARTKLQWDLLTKSFKDGCGIPVHHTLGNHDVWGWNKGKSKTKGDEPMWGKKWAMDLLGMKRYSSFDQNGWHIITLDSVHTDPNDPNGYIGKLDEEQMEWLKGDLASVKPGTSTLIVSHIPILTVTVVVEKPDKQLKRDVSAGLMHVDARPLIDLFAKHSHVKACLSGHMHLIDRADYQGVSYYCNGAVCGAWWKGPHQSCNEGYAMMNLFDDGTVEREYVEYGWKAEVDEKS